MNATIPELDKLVSEYLIYRNCEDANQLFLSGKDHLHDLTMEQKASAGDRILHAFDTGDYPQLVALWDQYLVQSLKASSSSSTIEARNVEFLCHLHCATYPFRTEAMQRAGGRPEVAAKLAARSMTIYKHFVDTRGVKLVQKDQIFAKYRGLHKIAFPPIHPQFRHLFVPEWVPNTRKRVENLLKKLFDMQNMPQLYSMFRKVVNMSNAFKMREQKLIQFSQSIFDITSELLGGLESGKPADTAFISDFREKLNMFKEVLKPATSAEEYVFKSDGTIGTINISRPGSAMSVQSTSDASQANHSLMTKGKRGKAGRHKRSSQLIQLNVSNLKFDDIASDLNSNAKIVKNFLAGAMSGAYRRKISRTTEEKDVVDGDDGKEDDSTEEVKGGDGHSNSIESYVAGEGPKAYNAAMTASALAFSLVHLVVRPDKDFQSKASRDAVVSWLTSSDVLGILSDIATVNGVEPEGGGNLSARLRDSSDGGLLKTPRDSRDGVLGAIEALRFTKVHAKDTFAVTAMTALLTDGYKSLVASHCLAETVCRLVVALSTSPSGEEYLRTNGIRLTINISKLLASLPAPLTLLTSDTGQSSYPMTVLGTIDEKEDEVYPGSVGTNPQHLAAEASLSLWMLLALTVLASGGRNHQHAIARHGCLPWLGEALETLIIAVKSATGGGRITDRSVSGRLHDSRTSGDDEEELSAITESGDNVDFNLQSSGDSVKSRRSVLQQLDVVLGLLLICLQGSDVRRMLVSSASQQNDMSSLLQSLFALLQMENVTRNQAECALTILKLLAREIVIRQIARDLHDVIELSKLFMNGPPAKPLPKINAAPTSAGASVASAASAAQAKLVSPKHSPRLRAALEVSRGDSSTADAAGKFRPKTDPKKPKLVWFTRPAPVVALLQLIHSDAHVDDEVRSSAHTKKGSFLANDSSRDGGGGESSKRRSRESSGASKDKQKSKETKDIAGTAGELHATMTPSQREEVKSWESDIVNNAWTIQLMTPENASLMKFRIELSRNQAHGSSFGGAGSMSEGSDGAGAGASRRSAKKSLSNPNLMLLKYVSLHTVNTNPAVDASRSVSASVSASVSEAHTPSQSFLQPSASVLSALNEPQSAKIRQAANAAAAAASAAAVGNPVSVSIAPAAAGKFRQRPPVGVPPGPPPTNDKRPPPSAGTASAAAVAEAKEGKSEKSAKEVDYETKSQVKDDGNDDNDTKNDDSLAKGIPKKRRQDVGDDGEKDDAGAADGKRLEGTGNLSVNSALSSLSSSEPHGSLDSSAGAKGAAPRSKGAVAATSKCFDNEGRGKGKSRGSKVAAADVDDEAEEQYNDEPFDN